MFNVSIDYPGWETVDFENMKHKFDDGAHESDIRDLKRVDADNWLIKDDYDVWIDFGENTRDENGSIEVECIESYYQSWLKVSK